VPDFRNAGTRDVFDGDDTNAARKILPMELHGAARRKMAFIRLAVDIDHFGIRLVTGWRFSPEIVSESIASGSIVVIASASYGTRTGQSISKSSIIISAF
jgi:hypothetical protein